MALIDRIETASLTWMHWLAGALALLSGVVHLVLGVVSPFGGLSVAFILAGLGFLGGLVLGLLDYRRHLLYLVGIVFVLLQIVIYYFVNFTRDGVSPLEGIDKVAQVILVVLLVILYRRES